jgi:hypothetical protein
MPENPFDDPVWDIASHVHRAAYPPGQAQPALQRLLGSCPDWTASASDHQAYDVYLRVEQYNPWFSIASGTFAEAAPGMKQPAHAKS